LIGSPAGDEIETATGEGDLLLELADQRGIVEGGEGSEVPWRRRGKWIASLRSQ
jgi:hypothetical protein